MTGKYGLQNPLDTWDPLNNWSDQITESYVAASPQAGGSSNTASPPTPVILPDESAEAQAAVSASGSGGVGSVVAETSGGLTINLIFDAAAMAAPASFRAGIQQAAALLSAAISDHITLNFNVDYSGTGGGAAAGPDGGQWMSYSAVRSDLVNNASPGDSTFNALPTGSAIQGQSSVAVWNAQLKLWGLLGANDTSTDDGSATFATDIDPTLLVGVALHELTHAIGRVPYGSQPDIFDFYRFTSQGLRLFTGGSTAPAAYFSLDGGSTKIADYGQYSDASDMLNSGVQGANDPFNEYYTGSTLQQLTPIDLQQLDALGFHLTGSMSVIESFGSTSLVQIGSNYFLEPVGSNSGPELKFGGSPFSAGQFGAWTPIGVEPISTGYQVAWKVTGSDEYTIWNVDSSGNYTSNVIGIVPGSSPTLERFEPSFHQDLNVDGVIGLSGTSIEGAGSTNLLQIGSNYYLASAGSGPELNYNGTPVTAGQFGSFAPIGAEATGGGYELAWKAASVDQYTVWNLDSHGNYIANAIGVLSGSSFALESYESSFHQDLNGDGVIGLSGTVIEAAGSTTLLQIGSNYCVVTGGASPELNYNGTPVTAGQFGSFAPIGAEVTGAGCELAWKAAGADQYTVWNLDSHGNYIANAIGVLSGSSFALESCENSFHQDLNGDGVIGFSGTVIEATGSTTLLQTASNYYLTRGGAGPELSYGGSPITVNQFGGWAPIGVEATNSGYVLAWKMTGADQYTVWNLDSNGNYIANAIGIVSGSSAAFESYESSFHQDLNADGIIGIRTTMVDQIGQNYFLDPIGGTTGSGPELKYSGTPVISGQFGSWAIIAAQAVSGGYELAWKVSGADQYTIWNIDSGGNYIANAIGVVSGSGTNLENYENIFHQDLNGDGTIGISATSPAATSAGTQTTLASAAQDNFQFALGSNGGAPTIASTPPGGSASPIGSSSTAHDAFVFAPNSGHAIGFDPAPITEAIQTGSTNLSVPHALAAHEDHSSASAAIETAYATPTLQTHAPFILPLQHDFHLV